MPSARRVLVIGGDSHLGAALAQAHARCGDEVITTTRRNPSASANHLDLVQVPAHWQPSARTDVAYLCAGITSIQRCEEQPEDTARANVDGTIALCRALARNGVFVVFFSTNLVFDGTTPFVAVEAPPNPQCTYGRQKAAVEAMLRDENIPSAIVRLTKVIDPTYPLFKTWVAALQRSKLIAPFTDMVMAPIALEYAVKASIAVAERRFHGIVHLSAARDLSYFEAARHLAKCLGASAELVQPNTARTALMPARFIPQYTTLAPSAHAPISFTPPDPLYAVEASLAPIPLV